MLNWAFNLDLIHINILHRTPAYTSKLYSSKVGSQDQKVASSFLTFVSLFSNTIENLQILQLLQLFMFVVLDHKFLLAFAP